MGDGAVWVDSPKEVARLSEVVCTCLPGPLEMEDVVFGENGIADNLSYG